MKTIKRYDLQIEPRQTINIPFNSEILRISMWGNKPAVYVLIDTNFDEIERVFHIIAQDTEVPARFNQTHYVGSFEHKAEVGAHILHVFEER